MKVEMRSSQGGLENAYGGICKICETWLSNPVIDSGPHSFFDFILNGVKSPTYCHFCYKHLSDVGEFNTPLC